MLNIWYSGRTGLIYGKSNLQTNLEPFLHKLLKCQVCEMLLRIYQKSYNAKRWRQREQHLDLVAKQQLCTCSIITFFYISLPLLHVSWRRCRICWQINFFLIFFFLHCCSFSPYWSLAFLIFSPPLHNFHVVLSTKFVFFVFYLLSRSSSFSVIHVSVSIN